MERAALENALKCSIHLNNNIVRDIPCMFNACIASYHVTHRMHDVAYFTNTSIDTLLPFGNHAAYPIKTIVIVHDMRVRT